MPDIHGRVGSLPFLDQIELEAKEMRSAKVENREPDFSVGNLAPMLEKGREELEELKERFESSKAGKWLHKIEVDLRNSTSIGNLIEQLISHKSRLDSGEDSIPTSLVPGVVDPTVDNSVTPENVNVPAPTAPTAPTENTIIPSEIVIDDIASDVSGSNVEGDTGIVNPATIPKLNPHLNFNTPVPANGETPEDSRPVTNVQDSPNVVASDTHGIVNQPTDVSPVADNNTPAAPGITVVGTFDPVQVSQVVMTNSKSVNIPEQSTVPVAEGTSGEISGNE